MTVSRTGLWGVVGGVAAIVLLSAWFLATHDREFYEARGRPQPHAARNAWLAAEMLLARFGYSATTSQEAAALDRMPPRGTVIMSSERQYHLTPSRTAALLAWVEDGGLLIADAAGVGANDPLLKTFDIRLAPPRAQGSGADAESDRNEGDDEPKSGTKPREPPRRAVAVPGYGRELYMRSGRWPMLYPGTIAPAWQVAGDTDKRGNTGYEMLAFGHGAGRIVLVNGLWRFEYGLRHDDHAEILLALVATHQRDGDVRILARLAVPSLFEWLWDNAVALLASAAILFAFWLWRIVPRFGVLRPAPARARRSLIAHLRAIGRFLWRQRAQAVLLSAARANVKRRLERRGLASPEARATPLASQVARIYRMPEAELTLALEGMPMRADQYAAAMATLFDLERRIDDPVPK